VSGVLKGLLAAAALALSSGALAAPCATGTFADYIALGSCEIASTTFSGFGLGPLLPAGAVEIAPASIGVVPVVSPTNPGFQFVLTTAATDSDLFSVLLQFQVAAGAGLSLIGVHQTFAGAADGNGVAILVTDLCLDGTFASPPSDCLGIGTAALTTFVDAFGSALDELVVLAPVGALDAVANFIVDGGNAGTAAVTGGGLAFATDAAATVNEPGVLALLALASLAGWARRRVPRRSR
jgi:hypothetical protein